MKIIIINGPNLNLLGVRQPEIYGSKTFEEYFMELQGANEGVAELEYYQSNHEGALIDKIQEIGFEYDGIIINAGGYTHTSIAIADALAAVKSPAIEVHISNIYTRESFRHVSYLKAQCIKSIVGEGLPGYQMAIDHLLKRKET